MAAFRLLQPASLNKEHPTPPQARPVLTQKPKRTVTLGACVACRKRKSKCDGLRPVCTCCTQKDTECIYELGPNEKPSQAMKRKNEEMQGELSNLRQLYDFLRLRPEPEALAILRRLRAGPPETPPSERIQELADLLRRGPLLAESAREAPLHHQLDDLTLPPLRIALNGPHSDHPFCCGSPFTSGRSSVVSDGPSSQRRRHASDADVSARSDSRGPASGTSRAPIEAILHGHPSASLLESTDSRLVCAKAWTNVQVDTNTLVHLMSAWHTWEYRYHHFLDWDIFLDDMAAQRTDFCSELLVNAILSSASFQSSLVKDCSKPFSDNNITLFYREARRLWEAEEGQASLPRLQAGLLLFMVLGKHGRDKVGYSFLAEACRIAFELGLFRLSHSSSPGRPSSVPSAKWERARAVTAWALFNFHLSMVLTYAFPINIRSQPPQPIPYDDNPESEALFRSECDRHVIMLDCVNTIVDSDGADLEMPPKAEQIELLHQRLVSWWGSRPDTLDPITHPTPENLLAAMQYNVLILRIVQPFLDCDSSLERVRSYYPRAQAIASGAVQELRRLLSLQEVRHGWSNCFPYILHPIMVTSFGTLEEVAQQDASRRSPELSEPYHGLLTCLRALSSLSNIVFFAQPLFRLLTQSCESLGIELPLEALSILDHYRSDEWTRNAATVVSSQYVADTRKVGTGAENPRMDAIVSRWETMAIGESSTRPSLGSRSTSGDGSIS